MIDWVPSRKMTKYVKIEGKEYLNLATSNFLGFIGEKRIEVSRKREREREERGRESSQREERE